MNWFTGNPKKPKKQSRGVQHAQAELADADRRLEEAEKTLQVSEAVKLSLQELLAEDFFTPTILPRRGH